MQTIDTFQLIQFFQIKKQERTDKWHEEGDAAIINLSAEYNKRRVAPEVASNQHLKDLLLTYLAIIDVAANAGNREAKKRNLDITLWSEVPPTPIWSMAEAAPLRLAITKVIGKKFAKRPWYANYLATCLREAPNLDGACQITEVALSSLGDKQHTWDLLLSPNSRPQSFRQTQWLGSLLTRINKRVKLNPQYLSTTFADQIKQLVLDQLDSADYDEIAVAAAEVMLSTIIGRPVFCLSASHLAMLWSSAPPNALDQQPKNIHTKLFEKFTQTIVDVSLLPCDDSTKQYLRDVWVTTTELFYSSPDAATKSLSASNKAAINDLLSRNGDVENIDNIESLLAEISGYWSERSAECLIATPSLENLDGILVMARRRYGITEITPSTNTVPYDPIAHHLIGSDEKAIGQTSVKIIKPGYIKHRENGSFKVIKKALVEIIDE